MAALTVTGRQTFSMGNLKAEQGQVTLAATGDTVKTALGTIVFACVSPATASAGQYQTCTWSEATITLVAEGGTPVIQYFALGTA